jgi:hypothetical protein
LIPPEEEGEKMTDKDVQRNVRSSSEEGIQTPTQKHYHSLSEKDNFLFGERGQEATEKKTLLAKFKERERKWRKGESRKTPRKKQQDKASS